MSDATWALEVAVYDRIDDVLGAMSPSVPVWDGAPDDPSDSDFPYVEIGEASMSDASDKIVNGQEHSITLHIWSRDESTKEAKEIMSTIYENLHNANLTLTGYSVPICMCEFQNVLPDPEAGTIHGVARYRIVTASNT